MPRGSTLLVSVLLPLAGFVVIATLVLTGVSQPLDDWLLAGLHHEHAGALRARFWRDITALGGWPVLTGLTLAALGALALQRRLRALLFMAFAVAGGQLLNSGLKAGWGRTRPQIVEHGTEVFSHSFPSGHAMMAAITYCSLAIVATTLTSSAILRGYVFLLTTGMVLLTGYSRIELGVHWPSDVVAGWLLGLAWVMACRCVGGITQDGELGARSP